MVIIKEVTTKSDLKRFVKFGNEIYKGNSYYVPSLINDDMKTLDREANPAFEVCESIYFLALRDGKIVGRIAGIINNRANEVWKEKNARFGFLEFIDDAEVCDALFDAVEKWAVGKGMVALQGPLGFTDMDKEGMLIEGFDQLGTIATIYNHPYYPKHMERMGFVKDADWLEFKIYIPDSVPEKHIRIGEIVKKKYGLKVVKFNSLKEVMPYAHRVFETLNAAYAPLFGFAPLTERQIDYYIKMYFPLLNLKLVTLIVREADDAVAGFGITLPNLSHSMQKANGSLFPFGWFWLLKELKSKPKVVDLYLMGVLPEYSHKGVNALLFNDLIPVYQQLGVEYAESNVELETNVSVQSQWEYFHREHHKTRRSYIKKLTNDNIQQTEE